MALFRIRFTTVEHVTIERGTREEAEQYVQDQQEFWRKKAHHGEVTTVEIVPVEVQK